MSVAEKIVVLGASDNPMRPSYAAAKLLYNKGFDIYPVSINLPSDRSMELSGMQADTVTVFLHAAKQKKYYQYILSLHPKRIIFNPGTENPELEALAKSQQIQIIKGCTIAMLVSGIW